MILYLVIVFTAVFLTTFLFLYIFYDYLEYRQTNEFREFKLFESEYKKFIYRKKDIKKKIRNTKRHIQYLAEKLSNEILEKELRRRSISDLMAAHEIGEETVKKLYYRGYKTLKDIDSFFFRENLMPKYIGPIRYESIKNWYYWEKKQEKRR